MCVCVCTWPVVHAWANITIYTGWKIVTYFHPLLTPAISTVWAKSGPSAWKTMLYSHTTTYPCSIITPCASASLNLEDSLSNWRVPLLPSDQSTRPCAGGGASETGQREGDRKVYSWLPARNAWGYYFKEPTFKTTLPLSLNLSALENIAVWLHCVGLLLLVPHNNFL